MSEILISLNPKTCQEKLIWERHRNSELVKELKACKFEIGVLKSEIDELKEDTVRYKRKNYVDKIKEQIETIKKLKKDNEKLIIELIKYKINL